MAKLNVPLVAACVALPRLTVAGVSAGRPVTVPPMLYFRGWQAICRFATSAFTGPPMAGVQVWWGAVAVML